MKTIDRRRALAFADKRLQEAREIADRTDATGEVPEGWWHIYCDALAEAAAAYTLAGLGLLAGRVAFMARRIALLGAALNVRTEWQRFDRLNGRCGAFAPSDPMADALEADGFLDKCRTWARRYTRDDGTLPPKQVGRHFRGAFALAGLGLLAGRVASMARRVARPGAAVNLRVEWQRFDRLNASGKGAT